MAEGLVFEELFGPEFKKRAIKESKMFYSFIISNQQGSSKPRQQQQKTSKTHQTKQKYGINGLQRSF